jgi:uncharacterized protein YggE
MKLGMLLVGLVFVSMAHAEERRIMVSSFAEKAVDPNMVSLNLEVWSKASTAKQAQSANAVEYARVKKTLDNFKIKKEDLQTDSYSLNPEYNYDQKTQQNRLAGFRALQVLRVTLRKTEELGALLDAAVSESKGTSGINVNTIEWDTDKRSALELSALGDAVRSGRAKADELAKAAGVKIKGVALLSHGVAERTPVFAGGFRTAMKAEMAGDAGTQVAPGQVKVRVDVNAHYDIQ